MRSPQWDTKAVRPRPRSRTGSSDRRDRSLPSLVPDGRQGTPGQHRVLIDAAASRLCHSLPMRSRQRTPVTALLLIAATVLAACDTSSDQSGASQSRPTVTVSAAATESAGRQSPRPAARDDRRAGPDSPSPAEREQLPSCDGAAFRVAPVDLAQLSEITPWATWPRPTTPLPRNTRTCTSRTRRTARPRCTRSLRPRTSRCYSSGPQTASKTRKTTPSPSHSVRTCTATSTTSSSSRTRSQGCWPASTARRTPIRVRATVRGSSSSRSRRERCSARSDASRATSTSARWTCA